MIDVLLASANYMALDAKQRRKRRPYPPLATLYAASHLRQIGWNVALFDAMLASGEHEFEAVLARTTPRVVALYEDSFNFLSKMCLARMREAAQRMARAARAEGAVVVSAGPDVTDHPELYLDHGVSFAISGEGEHALGELVDAITRRDHDVEVAGIVVANREANGGMRRTQARIPEREPDRFPPPAWDLVEIERYRQVWLEAHGYFSVNLVSTRGCPFHCNWCAKPIWGQRYAMHSPSRIAEDMAIAKRELGADHVWFADDIFGLRPQWVTAFADEVDARRARLPFTIQSRADLMTDEAVRGLKDAGCIEVWLGAESGSQKILDAMDKGITVDQIVDARQRLKRAGIRACFFIQLGYPGETFDDILRTQRLVREQIPDNIGVSIAYPLPGTPFHARVRVELGAKANWMDSDDLAMMFQGTYDSAFYRRLHALLHRELELHVPAARGDGGAAVAEELDALAAVWSELARDEWRHRTRNPTTLGQASAVEAPDLSGQAN